MTLSTALLQRVCPRPPRERSPFLQRLSALCRSSKHSGLGAEMSAAGQTAASSTSKSRSKGYKMKERCSNANNASNPVSNSNNNSRLSPQASPRNSHVSGGGQASSGGRPKTCCFCWCCCCSCSCLNMKPHNDEASRQQNSSQNRSDPILGDEKIQFEDAKSWSESFDKLMQSIVGQRVLREFLRSEYSEENILFWLACEELKRENSADQVEEKARLIYEDFISILSPKEVSLDSRVREMINRNMMEPTQHTFDEAQLQIYTLMHRDSYPRFLNSQLYKRVIQQSAAQS